MFQRNSRLLALSVLPVALAMSACAMDVDETEAVEENEDAIDRRNEPPGMTPPRGTQTDREREPTPHHGSRCRIYRRGEHGHVKDATIHREAPDYNEGELETISAGQGERRKLALIGFDLSDLDDDVEIERADLGIWQTWTDSETPVTVHAIRDAWREHEVTWHNFGDGHEHEPLGSFMTHHGEGHHEVDVTKHLETWRHHRPRHGHEHHGFVIDVPGKRHAFRSSESERIEHRPFLRVCLAGITIVPPRGLRTNPREPSTTPPREEPGRLHGQPVRLPEMTREHLRRHLIHIGPPHTRTPHHEPHRRHLRGPLIPVTPPHGTPMPPH
ncbi:DNRLRE domain-containing protein [Chondromyces crocatus]|uniref:Carbohydrate-binding module family 96 domain-containing protein n=1 Tax=Chondromyces crocatus TaxID=52 RepID=A0A0K1E9L6_CHOCO|nr:DNRLRE domain-containing protein [Chondromyces crocatus]AKT37556.1 uncharacterized protein CMC5_016970 [Chondromyces crocatus]